MIPTIQVKNSMYFHGDKEFRWRLFLSRFPENDVLIAAGTAEKFEEACDAAVDARDAYCRKYGLDIKQTDSNVRIECHDLLQRRVAA